MTSAPALDTPTHAHLSKVHVPDRWAGLTYALLAGWTVFALALAGGLLAFTRQALAAEAVAVSVAVWALVVGLWLGRGRGIPAVVAVALVTALAAWLAGWRVPAVLIVVVSAAVVLWGTRALRRRAEVARRLVWLAGGLPAAEGKRRSPAAVLHPSWGSGHPAGLPIEWSYPSTLTPDAKKLGELEALVSARLGVPVSIDWRPVRALIVERTDGADVPTEDVDSARGRLTAVLDAMIPGAHVTKLERGDAGELVELQFSWPAARAARVSPPAYRGRVARALQGAVGESLTVTWDTARDRATARPLPSLPEKVPHPPRDAGDPMKVRFGQWRDGTACVWDLDSTLPHVLIVGGTGGGKTVLLLTLIGGLPPATTIYSIDPKRVGLKGLDRFPGALRPATDPEGFVRTLENVKAIMDDRFNDLENDRVTRADLEPIVLVIDEGQEMYDVLKSWWLGGEGKVDWMERKNLGKQPTGSEHPVMGTLGSILRLGREARVHVILASQQAAASWLQTSSRGQFAVRIALRNLSVDDSRMVFGSPVATAGLEPVPGRAWVAVGMGSEPQHAQIYWTPKVERGLNPEDRAILHGLGVSLPDDEQAQDPADLVHAHGSDGLAVAALAAVPPELRPVPQPPTPTAQDVTELSPEVDDQVPAPVPDVDDFAGAVELPVTAVEDGARIVVDGDDGPVHAIVESIDPDDADPDYLALTYRLDDGEVGVLSLTDTDVVQVLS